MGSRGAEGILRLDSFVGRFARTIQNAQFIGLEVPKYVRTPSPHLETAVEMPPCLAEDIFLPTQSVQRLSVIGAQA